MDLILWKGCGFIQYIYVYKNLKRIDFRPELSHYKATEGEILLSEKYSSIWESDKTNSVIKLADM